MTTFVWTGVLNGVSMNSAANTAAISQSGRYICRCCIKKAGQQLRIAIKKLAESNHLPDYRLRFISEDDKLTVYLRSHKGGLRELKDVLGL